jgi:lysophospholipase L1-like esterase
MKILRNEVAPVTSMLFVLLALQGVRATGWTSHLGGWTDDLVSTMSNRGLNKEAREALTAGYYEGLLNEGSRLSSMSRLVLDNRRPGWEDNKRPDLQQTNDFLYSEHIPNKATPDYEDSRFKYILTTNSAGMGDKEYPLEKPAGTRRIAMMGDSITRGLGAPNGENFESLLEAKLNEAHTTPEIRQFEILNFAVGGYHLTQQLEAARVKAAKYRPDVYIFALSDLSVYRRWHGHISTLMYAGIDLKYDYLKNLVRESRLTAEDPIGVFDARLARYRIPTIRWVLEEMKQLAAAQNAGLLVVLVPTTESPKVLAEAFLGVHEVIQQERIRFVDLLGTFAAGQDLTQFRVADGDRHPNAAGHRLLFEQLYAALSGDRDLMNLVTGGRAAASHLPTPIAARP